MARSAAKLRSVPPHAAKAGALPELTVGEIWFPADETANAAALHKSLTERLSALRERAEVDPFGDPILMLALDLTRMLDKGEVTASGVEQLVQHLTARTFEARAARLAAYVGETDPVQNDAKLEALLRTVAEGRSFEEFAAQVQSQSRHAGGLMTSHLLPRRCGASLWQKHLKWILALAHPVRVRCVLSLSSLMVGKSSDISTTLTKSSAALLGKPPKIQSSQSQKP